jgi:hypothetical protein
LDLVELQVTRLCSLLHDVRIYTSTAATCTVSANARPSCSISRCRCIAPRLRCSGKSICQHQTRFVLHSTLNLGACISRARCRPSQNVHCCIQWSYFCV